MAQNNRSPIVADAVREFADSSGRRWKVSVELKTFRARVEIAAVKIESLDSGSPITRRLLGELPLEKLFRDELAAESEHLARLRRKTTSSTAHQGRAHQDDELRVVAEIYVAAYRARIPVQKAVADELKISVSTAAKRIMAARRRGLIPLLDQGQ